MQIIKGRYAGTTGRVHQYANGWLTVRADGVPPNAILKPTMIRLVDEEDWSAFAVTDPRMVGRFWQEWRLNEDGTFTALRPARRRPAAAR